jgi:hypothetical protein
MEDREWMYTGRRGRNDVTTEWIRKTDDFVERAYGEAAKGASLVPCPCSKCANRKRKPKKAMVEHIWKNGFMSGYTRWIYHGEAHRTREEVLRQRVEDYDADAGVEDMLNDYQEAQYTGGCMDDEPEPTAKAFYDMFDAALSAFRPRGVPRPTSKLSLRVPAQMGRRETEDKGETIRGIAASCCPAPRADALAVVGYKRSRGREREPVRQPVLPRGHLLV